HHYHWFEVPQQHRTKKQFLKGYRRLKKTANLVGKISLIFDKPRARPRGVDPVSAEECERIRKKLERCDPDAGDWPDLHRLERSGQLATINLYDVRDTEPITSFTEREATKLLEYMVWDHSHEDHYITEATVDGTRQRATGRASIPNRGWSPTWPGSGI